MTTTEKRMMMVTTTTTRSTFCIKIVAYCGVSIFVLIFTDKNNKKKFSTFLGCV